MQGDSAPRHVLWLHGLTGLGRGAKSELLASRLAPYPDVRFHRVEFTPDPEAFRTKTISGMILGLRAYVCAHELDRADVVIVASSLGALVGLHYAQQYGGVRRMVLLAPFLAYRLPASAAETLDRWREDGEIIVDHDGFGKKLPLGYAFHRDALGYARPIPPPAPLTLLHGQRDTLIPASLSRLYAAAFPDRARFVGVDADHDMTEALDAIWEAVAESLLDDSLRNAS